MYETVGEAIGAFITHVTTMSLAMFEWTLHVRCAPRCAGVAGFEKISGGSAHITNCRGGGFVIDKALYGFILLAYRGREDRQVNQSFSSGTSRIGAINQS